jgi:hypothetical protein
MAEDRGLKTEDGGRRFSYQRVKTEDGGLRFTLQGQRVALHSGLLSK